MPIDLISINTFKGRITHYKLNEQDKSKLLIEKSGNLSTMEFHEAAFLVPVTLLSI